MNLPYMPGVRRVSPAGLPCDPGRVESGVRKRFRFIALLTLAVFMAGGTAASAATIANHMDYPVEARARVGKTREHRLQGRPPRRAERNGASRDSITLIS